MSVKVLRREGHKVGGPRGCGFLRNDKHELPSGHIQQIELAEIKSF
jgi:hypothetical protein